MHKYFLNICLILFLCEPILPQSAVIEGKKTGVVRDVDTKKYGIVDENGDTIVPFIYELLPNTVTERMIAKINSKFGIINSKNQTLLDFKYDELYSYHSYFLSVRKNKSGDEFGLCSVIDTNFVTIISEEALYNKIVPFSSIIESRTVDHLRNISFKAYNLKKRQVSLLLKNGELYKSFPYDDVEVMGNYLKIIIYRPNNEWYEFVGLMDWNGKILLKPKYRSISWVNNGNVCLYIEEDNSNAQILDLKTKKIKLNKYPRILEPEDNGCMIINKYENDLDYQGIINSRFEEIYPLCNCTIQYIHKEQIFEITDNMTKKIEYVSCK